MDGSHFTTEAACVGAGGQWQSAANRCVMSK
jgi:hypothetical protein